MDDEAIDRQAGEEHRPSVGPDSAAIDRYRWQFDAFFDLVALEVHATQLDSTRHRMAEAISTINKLGENDRKTLIKLIDEHTGSNQDELNPKQFTLDILQKMENQRHALKLANKFVESFASHRRLPILFDSLLVAAVSAFEVQIAGLARIYFSGHPEALDAGSRDGAATTFTLYDLKKLSNIRDAIDLAIDRRVESLLFGSLTDWRRFFKDRLNIDMADLSPNWEIVREVFQRRHIIVHNGGRVSGRYINQVKEFTKEKLPREGVELHCSRDYLTHGLQELLALGVLLSFSVLGKLHPSEKEYLTDRLQTISYEALLGDRWVAVAKMASYGATTSTLAESRILFTVNGWIARWRMEGRESIRKEVEEWDFSALAPRYQLAQACLLGNIDSAFEIMARLVDSGDIAFDDLIEWPLLQELREDPRFGSLTPIALGKGGGADGKSFFKSPKSKVFHLMGCSKIGPHSVAISESSAKHEDLAPCKRCNPLL
ncbi:hypothetical protein [Nonomuraea sp. NPDC048916]|uniref:hypothetical protein n=1 Tax=Nonomuraea sp. NPDC048916 TaxID=3154232 RepID=UPI0033C67672